MQIVLIPDEIKNMEVEKNLLIILKDSNNKYKIVRIL